MHGIAQFTHSNNEINIHIIVNLHFWLSDLNGILIICIRHTLLLGLSTLQNISMEFSSLVSLKKSLPKIWADGNEMYSWYICYHFIKFELLWIDCHLANSMSISTTWLYPNANQWYVYSFNKRSVKQNTLNSPTNLTIFRT